MRAAWLLGAALACGIAGATAAADPPKAGPSCAVPGMSAVFVAGPGLYTGGGQDEAQLLRLKEMGVRHVVDLRPADEKPPKDAPPAPAEAEAQLAARLGLSYRRLPVRDADELTEAKVRELEALLAAHPGEATLVHCATGNRSAALIGLRERVLRGKSAEDSLSLARRAGLTNNELDAAVQRRLAAVTPGA